MPNADHLLGTSGAFRGQPALTAFQGAARRPLSTARRFAKDEAIFWEGDQTTNYYQVAEGAVRSCKILEDGRRQIVAFHIVDDVFGVEYHERHSFSAEAIEQATVHVLPWRETGWQEVFAATLLSLGRAQRHEVVLGRELAIERVASLLLDLAERLKSDTFELPMTRRDIGDYLGLTIETVSRTLTQFAKDALIKKAARQIVLLNKQALQRLHEGVHRAPMVG